LIRLNKFLAIHGVGSRRYCESLIQEGKVLVNGEAACLGMKIDPRHDQIFLADQGKITPKNSKLHYIMLYKPTGYLTTMADPLERQTIRELIPEIPDRIYPIGRLDYQSEGLILLTSDGNLAYRISHPSSGVPKTYLVKVKGHPSPQLRNRLVQGIKLKDGWSSLDEIREMKSRTLANTWFRLVIHSGKNHIIRRMFMAIGHPVVKLKRISIAGVGIGQLKPGQWRFLTTQEIQLLKEFGNKKEK